MASTTRFREQHTELMALAGEIAAMLDPARVKGEPEKIRHLLSQLAGKLKIHLAVEDNALYPTLLAHPSPEIQAKAKAFVDEMGGIKQAFMAYLDKYPSPRELEASPEAFVRDTRGLFAVLEKRIHAEDTDLYQVLDAL